MEKFRVSIIDFISNSEAVLSALAPLKNSAVICLKVDEQIDIKLKRTQTGIEIIKKENVDPDITILLNFEAARHLLSQRTLDKTEFAIEVLKEATMGNVDLKVHRSVLKLMRLGFIKVVTSIGAPFWAQLSTHGISSLSKLNHFLSKIRTDN